MKSLKAVAAVALLAGVAFAQDADTPLDKALQKAEALLAALKATPSADAKVVAGLEEIAANLRKEKDARGGGGRTPQTPWDGGAVDKGIMARTEEAFFKGTDLKEDEKTLGKQVILEFVADYTVAKAHEDEKSKAVIREHTEKRVARSFASKDANKMKDNLNGIIQFWEGRWGRGGR
jgi:hypothetical protein